MRAEADEASQDMSRQGSRPGQDVDEATELRQAAEDVKVVETRFSGEYLVFSVPRSVEGVVVGHLIQCLAQLRFGVQTGIQSRYYDCPSKLDPSYGLVEILKDGSAVRRVVEGSGGGGGGVSSAVVALILTCIFFAIVAVVQKVWPCLPSLESVMQASRKRYGLVTASGAEAVAVAEEEEIGGRASKHEDEVLIESGSDSDDGEEVK